MILIEDLDTEESCIYCIWSLNDNRRYIGQARNYNIRVKRHEKDLAANRHGNLYLQRVFNKQEKLLIISVIEICDATELNTREIFWIETLKTNNAHYGYNMTSGGYSISPKLNIWTEERRKSQSEKMKFNNVSRGVKKSDEWKRKMKATLLLKSSLGLINRHFDKKCMSKNLITNEIKEFSSIKNLCQSLGLNYTHTIGKLKNNEFAKYKNYIISKA